VVFVTAYDQYAVAAFEEGAVDYVMKPFSAARMATAIKRVRQRLAETPANLEGLLRQLGERATGPRGCLRWINATQGANVRVITVDEVCYFQADTKYTRVVMADSETLIRKTLRELTNELDPEVFWQIHRSTIVNANAISAAAHDLRGRLVVKLKARPETLEVSHPYAHLFRQM
jgi:DNA-binding LytR/AlgR family response regulator